ITPDACYFDISAADQSRMYAHASAEVRRLTNLAMTANGPSRNSSTGKIIAALLSSEVGEKLEPFRATLRLGVDEFREGIFSWRGFIYYKWCMAEVKPEIINVIRDLAAIRIIGKADAEQLRTLNMSKRAVAMAMKKNTDEVHRVLEIY